MSKKDLQDQLKQSMLARDTLKTSVLRMLLSAIGYLETNKGGVGYKATDEDVLSAIQKEVKQHKDSIEQFKNANRQDLVDKETKELEILQKYLPAQMDETEIKQLVDQTVAQTGAANPSDMGKVMNALMSKIKGRADGGLVSRLVKEALNN